MAGHPVTAVDLDPAMLDRAARRAARAGVRDDRLELVEADLLELRLPDAGRYALAFIALNSIMLLATREAQRARVAGPGRPPRARAASPWSTSGCRTPRTSPGSTAG